MAEEQKTEEQKEEKKEIPEAAAPAATSVEKKSSAPTKVPRGKGSRPKQCSQCSKNLKKKTWYYRDNKYFCNKRCWKASKIPKAAAA